jgi:N4-(beta-N-acetylglucosaminyl)-L-asparaginase
MINRRKFLEQAGAAGALIALPGTLRSAVKSENSFIAPDSPVVISTWNHGLDANLEAIKVINDGGSITDAVEKGVMVVEADPDNMSVGIGGLPDITGHVTLDASIMGPDGNAGSVCFLENIMHPISVARLVMDSTPHVMLAGDGALQFALENGFEEQDLLTEKSKKAWLKDLEKKRI